MNDLEQEIHDRSIEIRTLTKTAAEVRAISPEAAQVIRAANRLLLKEQYKALATLNHTVAVAAAKTARANSRPKRGGSHVQAHRSSPEALWCTAP